MHQNFSAPVPSGFTTLQSMLRNALVHARSVMKLTDENYGNLVNAVSQLTPRNWLTLGIGEDVASMSPEIQLVDDQLVVDEASATPGIVVFTKVTYPAVSQLQEIVLEGENVSVKVTKLLSDNSVKIFNTAQLPLRSNNFTLTVTIMPGGSLKRAIMLMELPT